MSSTLSDRFVAVASKLSGTQPKLSTEKEFATRLLVLHAPATEHGFGFCQQHLEYPSTMDSVLALHQAAPGSNLGSAVPRYFLITA